MKTKNLLSTFAILFIALISGCAEDDFIETVGICPVVESTIPTPGAVDVSLNQKISATFNEEMDPETFIDPATTAFTVETGGTKINGLVTYSGLVATFTPSTLLLATTEYTARIKTTAKDLAGNALQTEYVWKFITGVAPFVVSTDPAPLATNVPLNKTITALFNMAMDPATLIDPASTFTVKDDLNNNVAGVVTYSGLTASFKPNSLLLAGKTYTATVSTAAKNVAGVPMAIAKVWSFSTGVTTALPPGGSTLGVFGGSAGITNQGLFTRINNGSISTTAAATLVTGFHDVPNNIDYTVTPLNEGLANGGIIVGTAANPDYNTALALYNSISPASKPGGEVLSTVDLGGQILAPGIYTSASTINIINGDLTLNGSATDVWIFQAGSSLTVGGVAPVSIKLTGGALASNVFWYVKETAVINYAGGGVMVGTIAANSGITLSNPANSTNAAVTTLNGKAISIVASVTMVNTVINIQ
jgi:hypothetical protein